MESSIHAHGIYIEIYKEQPDIKYKVEHKDGEIIVTEKKKSEWKNHSIFEGKITFGSFSKTFRLYCELYSLKDFQEQWQKGLDRLDQCNESCFVMRMFDIHGSPLIEWWLFYKIGNAIHIQFRIVVGSIYEDIVGDKLFTLKNCYDFIPKRQTKEDDGEVIQEVIIQIS